MRLFFCLLVLCFCFLNKPNAYSRELHLFDPTDNIKNITSSVTLKWEGDKGLFTVYLDTVENPQRKIAERITDTTLIVVNLKWWKTYYWKVIRIVDTDTLESQTSSFNLPHTVRIRDHKSLEECRDSLIRYIWGKDGFPDSKFPDRVDIDFIDRQYLVPRMPIRSIDRFRIDMELGFTAFTYHFHPLVSNGMFVFVHEGHSDNLYDGMQPLYNELLSKGFEIIAFWMPCFGPNSKPVFTNSSGDVIDFSNYPQHDNFYKLDSWGLLKSGSFIKFFMEPIAVMRNYVKAYYHPKHIYMTGLSGGGWSTDVYSAIDTLIFRSYPVAGTSPKFLFSMNGGGR